MRPLLELLDATITAPGGRTLFAGLTLRLGRERVALVGRNGVGKSTLLAALFATTARHPRVAFVPQLLHPEPGLSHGELRRRELARAASAGADAVLLDEPTCDLDEAGVAWLRGWLREHSGAVLVASHDRQLLQDFRCFFVATEAGCRAFSGTLDELDGELERDHHASQVRYARGLHRLEAEEAHVAHVARRKARKKRYGRCSELDRGTPRVRLNQKREQAQVSHGKLARQRSAQLEAARAWTRSLRRGLQVELPLDLPAPTLPADDGAPIVGAEGVAAAADGRALFMDLDLRIGRQRVAVVGPNGAGKTTLLGILRGDREPSAGRAWRDPRRIGSIAQGAADWVLEESLLEHLAVHSDATSLDAVAATLLAHRFPLALSQRPLASLSPGERVRAALIALFHRAPRVELLLLDEPTEGLDLLGQRALTRALCAFPGGLVVATHDRALLAALAPSRVLALGASAAPRAHPVEGAALCSSGWLLSGPRWSWASPRASVWRSEVEAPEAPEPRARAEGSPPAR